MFGISLELGWVCFFCWMGWTGEVRLGLVWKMDKG